MSDSLILEEVLSAKTEFKDSNNSNTPNFDNDSFWNIEWNSKNDFKTEKEIVQIPTTQNDNQTQQSNNQGAKKITNEQKIISAKIAVGALETTLTGVLVPLSKWKFKKKYNEEKLEKLDTILDLQDVELDAVSLALKKKYLRDVKKFDQRMDSIPFDDDEAKKLQDAFAEYFQFKNISIPPEWLIVFALMDVVGSRIIDVAFD